MIFGSDGPFSKTRLCAGRANAPRSFDPPAKPRKKPQAALVFLEVEAQFSSRCCVLEGEMIGIPIEDRLGRKAFGSSFKGSAG